ncbi:MAG: nicotinamide-nucleotide adenylyltransferase [Candidatus Thermoplasmatota archaeon]|nr:nicotinamide-nucleotide adenylyltransferase [Candidatus Thermoplasmatota archaeon]
MAGGSPSRVLFVGRFQPFHLGHLHMVKSLLREFDEVVLILGSSQASHTSKNPFSLKERTRMIRESLQAEGVEAVRIVPLGDVGDHAAWLRELLTLAPAFGAVATHDNVTRHIFERAGYRVLDPPLLDRDVLSGTEVRERIRAGQDWERLVPDAVRSIIRELDGVERIRSLDDQ